MCDYSTAKFIIREGAGGDVLGGFWVRRRELKLVKLPAEDKWSERRSGSPFAAPAVDWLFSCKSSQPGLVVEHAGMSKRLKGLWRTAGWKTNDPDRDRSPMLLYVKWLARRGNRRLWPRWFASLTLLSLQRVSAHSDARLLEMSSPAIVGFTPFIVSTHSGGILVLWALLDGRIAFTCPSLFTSAKTIEIPTLPWSRWCKLYCCFPRLAVGLVGC